MRQQIEYDRINNSIASDWCLSNSEVIARRKEYGINDITQHTSNRVLEVIIDVIKDPMIWLLIACSLLFALIKDFNQAGILLLAVIPLMCMDAYLHWRTSSATKSLKSKLAQNVVVMRDNKQQEILATDIVPGDLVLINLGSIIPADGLIVSGKDLKVDESALTGEAMPVSKLNINSLELLNAVDDAQWGYAGTVLLTGSAMLRVIYTGKQTLYGKIISSVLSSKHQYTPLQRALARLTLLLVYIAAIFCLILAIVRYIQGFGITDALLSAAVLAMAALPDEFPVVFTVFLGVGVYRLAQNNTLVRKAVAIENIGRVTTICTDKTGTITEGKINFYKCLNNKSVSEAEIIKYAATASRLQSGDPIDLAILSQAKHLHLDLPKSLTTFPFTEERLQETSAITGDKSPFVYVTKGSPEKILKISKISTSERSQWQQEIAAAARQGYKVIAVAYLPADNLVTDQEPQQNYIFMGLLLFSDPVRKEVKAAIEKCIRSGIHVLMITGDHPETARTIAIEIGLGAGNPTVIEALEAQGQALKHENYYRSIDVVARAIPSQKLNIVNSLQRNNEIVVVTGDGVNDVPALQAADIGVAMGLHGTQSARESAKMILLDDNFSSIVAAISEGRQLFANLRKSYLYLLLIHIPFILSACIIPMFGFPLLYEPVNIVLIELFIHPTSILVFQNLHKEENLEKIQPNRSVSFFSKKDWLRIILLGGACTLLILFIFVYIIKTTNNVDHARGYALALLSIFSAAITVGLTKCATKISIVIIIFTIGLAMLCIQLSPLAQIFSVAPLSVTDWIFVFLIGFFVAYFAM